MKKNRFFILGMTCGRGAEGRRPAQIIRELKEECMGIRGPKTFYVLLCVITVVSLLACASTSSGSGAKIGKSFESAIDWDAEYDVVVVGFGGAGATADIIAADAGAKVLLLEKAPMGNDYYNP
jgi:hypothetical protein